MSMEKKNKTKVLARFMPQTGNESNGFFSFSTLEKAVEKSILTTVTGTVFQLDAVEIATPQVDFFHRYVEPCVDKVLSGYNSSLLCYGYTGTGKTYTIFGREGDPGMAGHAMDFIMADGRVKSVTVQILEVYMEKIYDLLDGRSQSPVVQKTGICGTVSIQVEDSVHLERIVASVDRKTKKTMVHDQSSRSHCIMIFRVETQGDDGYTKIGELYLVDLAGCERLADAEKIDGLTLQESKAINKSVFAINTVIKACAENSSHIPYRDSKITMLLQRAIGGNSFTVIVLCCSQANIAETITTLRFGQRCQRVSNEILPPVILPREPGAAVETFAGTGQDEFPMMVSEVFCSDRCTRHEHECMENTITALRLELKDLNSMLDEANKTILNSTSASMFSGSYVAAKDYTEQARNHRKQESIFGKDAMCCTKGAGNYTEGAGGCIEEAGGCIEEAGDYTEEAGDKTEGARPPVGANQSKATPEKFNEEESADTNKSIGKAEKMENTKEENVYMITLNKTKMQKLIEGIDKKDVTVVSVKQNKSCVKIKGLNQNKDLFNLQQTTQPLISEPLISEPLISEPLISEPLISEPLISEPLSETTQKQTGLSKTSEAIIPEAEMANDNDKSAANKESKSESPSAREALKKEEAGVKIPTPKQGNFETTCSFCRCK